MMSVVGWQKTRELGAEEFCDIGDYIIGAMLLDIVMETSIYLRLAC